MTRDIIYDSARKRAWEIDHYFPLREPFEQSESDPKVAEHAVDAPHWLVKQLHSDEVLQILRKETWQKRRIRVWQINPKVVDVVRATVRNAETILPCGHPGLCNRGDTYQCRLDFCDEEFERSEVSV